MSAAAYFLAMDLKQLLATLTIKVGKKIHGHTSRDHILLECGYSHVRIDRSGSIQARKEGEGERNNLDRVCPDVDFETAYVWMVSILIAGRTVEVGQGVDYKSICGWWPRSHVNMSPKELVRQVVDRGWDLNPDYQRGHVWTPSHSERFMGHFLEGNMVPPFYVQRWDSEKNAPPHLKADYWDHAEVVDGQQRIRAITAWLDGSILAELSDGRRIAYRDFDEVERRCLPVFSIYFFDISRAERLKFYLKLNRAGVYHTDAEIDKVRKLLENETTTRE